MIRERSHRLAGDVGLFMPGKGLKFPDAGADKTRDPRESAHAAPALLALSGRRRQGFTSGKSHATMQPRTQHQPRAHAGITNLGQHFNRLSNGNEQPP